MNKIERNHGMDELEVELKKKNNKREDCRELRKRIRKERYEMRDEVRSKEMEVYRWVEKREKEFYDNELEKSKFKKGVNEIMEVIYGMKERMDLKVVFVSDYRRSKIESILWRNGLRNVEIESCDGNWIERIIERSGKAKEEMVLFSNNKSDLENSEKWGIRVEKLNADEEGVSGFMNRIGFKKKSE